MYGKAKREKKPVTPIRRAVRIATSVLTAAIVVFAIYVFVSVFVAKSNDRPVSIFGYSYYVVVTDSMTPSINRGDFVAVKIAGIEKAKEGDVVVFYNRGNYPELASDASVIHRVREIRIADDGTITLITHGDANPVDVVEEVTEGSFIGILAGTSAAIGAFVSFVSNPINWIFAVILIAAAFVAVRMGYNVYRHFKEKGDKQKERELLISVAREMGLDPEACAKQEQTEPKPVLSETDSARPNTETGFDLTVRSDGSRTDSDEPKRLRDSETRSAGAKEPDASKSDREASSEKGFGKKNPRGKSDPDDAK